MVPKIEIKIETKMGSRNGHHMHGGGLGPRGMWYPFWQSILVPIVGTILATILEPCWHPFWEPSSLSFLLYEMVRYTWYVIRNSLQVAQNWRAIVILLSDRSLSSGANNVSHHGAQVSKIECE